MAQSLNDEYEDSLFRDGAVKNNTVPRSVQPYPHLELSNLPRLPVLPLQETAKRYIQWLEPLLEPEALNHTRQLVDDFVRPGGEGEALQRELEQLNGEAPSSWLEGWWDTGYLEFRVPTVINVNPFFVFAQDPARTSQLQKGAQLLKASAEFHLKVRNNTLSLDKEGDTPLCMTQYGRILATCRIPMPGRDTVFSFTDSRHVVVLYRDQFFKIEVFDTSFNVLSGEALLAGLQEITRLGDAAGSSGIRGVGILTSEQRDSWASTRSALERESSVNRASLKEIDKALLILVLEESRGVTLQEMAPILLHGNGSANRWFDKLQLIVFADGNTGVNMEHAPLDGHTMLRFLTEVNDATLSWKGGFGGQQGASGKATVRPLYWAFAQDSSIPQAITTAHENFNALIKKTDVRVLEFVNFGASAIKSWKLSPDGFVQCAYQLAYYRMESKTASTYESAQTKRFLHGRTETLRSVTVESVAFAKIFSDPSASEAAKLESLKKAVAAHGRRGNEAKTGHGVDRHWLGLRSIASHKQQRYPGYLLPRMFSDPAFSKLSRSVLSTSNCGGSALRLFGFGAVVGEGLGIGYMIHPRAINVCVSSFTGKSATFVAHLIHALIDMQQIASAAVAAKPQPARL